MAASIAESDGSLPTKGLIPEKRDVNALESGQPDVVAAKVLDVSNAVNDDGSPKDKSTKNLSLS